MRGLAGLLGPGRVDIFYDGLLDPVTGLYLVDSVIAGEWDIFWNALDHLMLPASILGFFSLAYIARMTRSFMLDQLGQEYVTTARVKGVSERRVIWRHAFYPIRIQLITVIGLSYAALLEGSVDDRNRVLVAGHRQLSHDRASDCRYERRSRRDAGDWRCLHHDQQDFRCALPHPRPEGTPMIDWLLDDSPTSRLQANMGRAWRVWTALLRNPLAVVGALIVLALVIMAIFAPLIAPYSPVGQDLANRLMPPSAEHWDGHG